MSFLLKVKYEHLRKGHNLGGWVWGGGEGLREVLFNFIGNNAVTLVSF